MKKSKEFFSVDSHIIFSHRGYSGDYPENTIRACKESVNTGAKGLEIDIRNTIDGEVVIIHDSTIDRTTNGSGVVSQMTLNQLKQLDAGSWYGSSFADQVDTKIPTLEEIFQEFENDDIYYELDIKAPSAISETMRLVNKYNLKRKCFFVGVESVVNDIQKNHTGYLTYHGAPYVNISDAIKNAQENNHQAISWNLNITKSMTELTHVNRRAVRASYISTYSGQLVSDLLNRGVNFILTDYPNAAISVFTNRNIQQEITIGKALPK